MTHSLDFPLEPQPHCMLSFFNAQSDWTLKHCTGLIKMFHQSLCSSMQGRQHQVHRNTGKKKAGCWRSQQGKKLNLISLPPPTMVVSAVWEATMMHRRITPYTLDAPMTKLCNDSCPNTPILSQSGRYLHSSVCEPPSLNAKLYNI